MQRTEQDVLNRCKDIYLYLLENKEGANSNTLADLYGCSLKTIQRAMQILSHNGLVINNKRNWEAVPKKIVKSA